MIFLVKGDAMKVVSGHVTAHRSWNRPSNVCGMGIAGTETNYCVTMVFKEFNDNRICGIPRRDGFYPFCEIVCGCKNPFVLGRGSRMDFPYEI